MSMKKNIHKHIIFGSFYCFLALGITACQTVSTAIGGTQTRYGCVEGSILTLQPGYNRHLVDVTYHYDGQLLYRATLQAASSDFGERFRADDGTSFWLNGTKGLFSRPGEDMVLCHLQ